MTTYMELFAYAVLVAQPIIAFVGIIMNLIGLTTALEDLKLTRQFNGNRRIVASAHVEWETIRLLVQILFFIMGATSLIYLPDPETIFSRSVIVIINRGGLIIATFLLATKSFLGFRYNQRLLRLWIKGHEVKGEIK